MLTRTSANNCRNDLKQSGSIDAQEVGVRLVAMVATAAAILVAPANMVGQEAEQRQGYIFETKVDEDRDDVLLLENGAVVEVTSYLGYVGYRKNAILFFASGGCRVWIEGKRVYRCSVLRPPNSYARKTPAELVWIERISDNGDVLILSDGAVLEVLYQSYATSIWLPGEAILMDDSRLLHLDEPGEIIDVVRLR